LEDRAAEYGDLSAVAEVEWFAHHPPSIRTRRVGALVNKVEK
jgi:hypothetical protein